MDVSVVIPALNEERRIARATDAVAAELEHLGVEFEILCVDDGSTDATSEIVAGIAARDWRVILLRLDAHRGKGAAVRAGMLGARGDLVFFLDADLSTSPSAISDALVHLRNGADVVRGSRHCPGARVHRDQSGVRRLLGHVFLVLARAIADPHATDLTCGFKGFRRDAARSIFGRARLGGWAFDAETALIARKLGYVTREIPVEWSNDPDSRVRMSTAIVGSLMSLASMTLRALRGRVLAPPS